VEIRLFYVFFWEKNGIRDTTFGIRIPLPDPGDFKPELLAEVFVISRKIKVSVSVISRSRS